MKKGIFLWLFITDKSFRFWLKHTLFYAIRSHNTVRGSGSSDVIQFEQYLEVIFTNESLSKYYNPNIEFRVPPSCVHEIIMNYNNDDIEELRKLS